MRKCLRVLLLSAVFTVLLCGSALATNGIYIASGTGLEPQDANGTKVETPTEVEGKQVYADSVRVNMTYSGAVAEKEYLVFVLEASETSTQETTSVVPNAENIVYIDQKSGTDANNGFNLYPSRLGSGKTYNVYVADTDNGIGAPVATFGYHADYVLGDVDGKDGVDSADALAVVNHVVKNSEFAEGSRESLAADVNQDGVINLVDAGGIINLVCKNITSFDQLKSK